MFLSICNSSTPTLSNMILFVKNNICHLKKIGLPTVRYSFKLQNFRLMMASFLTQSNKTQLLMIIVSVIRL